MTVFPMGLSKQLSRAQKPVTTYWPRLLNGKSSTKVQKISVTRTIKFQQSLHTACFTDFSFLPIRYVNIVCRATALASLLQASLFPYLSKVFPAVLVAASMHSNECYVFRKTKIVRILVDRRQ